METPRDCLRTADPRPFSEGMSKRYGHAIILLLHTALNHQAKLSKKLSRTPAVLCLAQRHSEPGNHPSLQQPLKKARESNQDPLLTTCSAAYLQPLHPKAGWLLTGWHNEIDAFECNSHEIAPPCQASLYGEAF